MSAHPGTMRKHHNYLVACLLLRAAIAAAQVSTPAALNTALGTNAQAAIISLSGIDPLSCPQISMSQTWDGGKLIFSDSPESPSTRGILYRDTNLTATAANLTNRIFAYHVNSNSVQMRFSVLIQNNGASNGTLTVQRSGIAGPSTDYPFAGEIAFLRWLTNAPGSGVTVAPGQIVRLDTTFDTINVSQNFLLHDIWDYTFTQPHSVIICALNTSDNPITVGPTLPVLARDTHERGTFASCNKLYDTTATVNTTGGIQQFPVAGNGDAFATGFDNAVSPPTAETDDGNYGVLYKIQLALASGDGRALGLLLNPRGGEWCGAASLPPGLFPGGQFLVPANEATLSDDTEAVIAGGYSPGSGTNIPMLFMPTGAASFPLRMMTVPYNAVTPSLAAISNFTVNPGQTVSFTASASDANPNQSLTFSLATAPAVATIGAANGIFHWRPPVASANTSNTVQVVVSDGSTPPLTASRTFAIVVNPLAPTTVTAVSLSAGQFQLQSSGTIGPDYVLQANSSVTNPGGWTNLATNTPAASPFTLADTNTAAFAARFYRLLLGP
jgi:hypothetical protein